MITCELLTFIHHLTNIQPKEMSKIRELHFFSFSQKNIFKFLPTLMQHDLPSYNCTYKHNLGTCKDLQFHRLLDTKGAQR